MLSNVLIKEEHVKDGTPATLLEERRKKRKKKFKNQEKKAQCLPSAFFDERIVPLEKMPEQLWASFMSMIDDQKKAIPLLNKFIELYGMDAFEKFYKSSRFKIDYSNDAFIGTLHSNLLSYTILKQYKDLFKMLLSLDVSVNDVGISIEPKPLQYSPPSFLLEEPIFCHGDTPLMVACQVNALDMIKPILEKNPDLFRKNSRQVNVLMKVNSIEACNLILEEAKACNCVLEEAIKKDYSSILVFSSDYFGRTALEHACMKGNIAILKRLMKIKDHRSIPISEAHFILRHYARQASFYFPHLFNEFDKMCSRLIKEEIPLAYDHDRIGLETAYNNLFNESLLSVMPNSKQTGIERAIAQLNSLLCTPERCLKYLKFINDELKVYYQEKHGKDFALLDRNTIQFKKIADNQYPLPCPNYIGIKKHTAFQEFLLLLFKKHDLPIDVFKWIGFIPEKIADKMMADGAFVIEGSTIFGLFHTRIAHMLQRAIFIYAAFSENKEIDLTYEENGEIKKVSVQEILNTIVTDKFWTRVMDSISSIISFSDPMKLGCAIMLHGKENGLDFLSDYLIDTFCKGIQKNLAIYNKKIGLEMSSEEFVEKLDDMVLTSFNDPQWVIQYSFEIAKSKKQSVKTGEFYGIVQKEYNLNRKNL